jgi:hypothetical protein
VSSNFLCFSLSTDEIEKHVQEIGILSELTSNEMQSAADNFVTRMYSNVYPLISGTDHERLLYYYTLLADCTVKDDAITPQTHIRLLKKLKSAAAGKMKFFLGGGISNCICRII